MSGRWDAIVIGSGIDELMAAIRLAGAGQRILVLERGDRPGGPAAGEELLPGFRIDPVWPDAAPFPARLAEEIGLERLGVSFLSPDPALVAPAVDGEPLVLWREPARSRVSIGRRSPADAERWVGFSERVAAFARILEMAFSRPAPEPTGGLRDLAPSLRPGWRVRSLGREAMTEFLRALTLPARDFLDDHLEDDLLKGALSSIAARGVFQGPRSPGTALVLLLHQAGSPAGTVGLRTVPRGGTAALAAALADAARADGVEIRCGEPVSRILLEEGRAAGVELEGGGELPARAVLSGAGPARTLLELAGARHLDPDFVHSVRAIRFRGGYARIHLALAEAPRFEGLKEPPAGSIVIAPDPDYVERAYDDAKHGTMSAHPVLEARIPSLADPSLAPPGRHVMSVDVRFLPVAVADAGGTLAREALADRAIELLASHAPGLPGAILERRVLTPADFEARYGWTNGDPYQGELALDQLLFMRPMPGWSRHRTPIRGLYLCGPGTHPAAVMAGISGRNAARAIVAELDRTEADPVSPHPPASAPRPARQGSPR